MGAQKDQRKKFLNGEVTGLDAILGREWTLPNTAARQIQFDFQKENWAEASTGSSPGEEVRASIEIPSALKNRKKSKANGRKV